MDLNVGMLFLSRRGILFMVTPNLTASDIDTRLVRQTRMPVSLKRNYRYMYCTVHSGEDT